MGPARLLALLLAGTLAGCAVGAVPEVDPREARALLGEAPAPLVVDVRPREAFEAGHLPGALRLSVAELDGYLSRVALPRDRPLLLACAHGTDSQLAGTVALARGFARVYSLKGGMEAWSRTASPVETGPGPALDEALTRPPLLHATPLEQLLEVIFGIGIKTTYMALSLVLVALLWRTRERGLALVRSSMVLFFFGEGMCALNFLFAGGESDSLELFHGLGMVGMGMYLPWGLARLLDDRVVRYADPEATCAMQRFCGHCWKREDVSCGLQRLFLFAAPALALTALLPLSAPLHPVRVEIPVLGSSMISAVSGELQFVEFRVYPLLASALLAVAFALVLAGRRGFALSQPFFFAGASFASFALLRFFLLHAFRERLIWADVWEEGTEFAAIAFVLFGLIVFRRQLGVLGFLDRKPSPAPSP